MKKKNHPFRFSKAILRLSVAMVVISLAFCILYKFNLSKASDVELQKKHWANTLSQHPYHNRIKTTYAEWRSIPKTDRPDLAMEQNVLMTMDPALGSVPTERKKIANLSARNSLQKKSAISNVSWQERGPNDVGGRTRALMFDPNDAANGYKKVWAGGVAGGLWYTDDITASPPQWNHVDGFWDNIVISCIAYNPNNTLEFYVGTGEGWYNFDAQRGGGIWKTSDGGITWNQLANTDPGAYNSASDFQYVNKIVVKDDGTIFAATRGYYIDTGGILKSTDNGLNWSNVLSVYSGVGALYDRAADIEIAANGDLYASFGIFSEAKVFKSTNANNGALGSWTDLSTNIVMGNALRVELACAPSDANTIYAVAQGGSGNTDIEWFKKSVNGGTSWSTMTTPVMIDGSGNHFTRGQAFYDLILAVHPTDPDYVLAGGIDLHRSTNGGSNWSGISDWSGVYGPPEVHADHHAIQFRPGNNNHVLFGHDGGISFSENAGNLLQTPSFSSKNLGYNTTQFYACAAKNEINSHFFLAGSQDNGSHKFTEPNIGLTTEVTGGDGAFCHIDQNNADIQSTAYTYTSIYRSLDGGNSFTEIIDDGKGHFINPSEYDSQRKILYAASDNNSLKRVSDFDGSFSNQELAISVGSAKISALKMSSYNDVLFLGIENGRIYKYTNASTGTPTLSRIDNGTTPLSASGWVSSIDIGANDDEILVTFSNYGVNSVWETTDGGTNWYSKEGDLPDMPIRWGIYNPENRDQVLLATEVGVWSTDNFGSGSASSPNWGASNTNLAHTRCDMLKYRSADKMVVVATHGRGLFTSDIFATTTDADFVADNTLSCNGSLTVQFSDASLKPNNSWQWDVDGDGIVDYTTQNPTHTYSSEGVYSVRLTVNDGEDALLKDNYIVVMDSEPAADSSCSLFSNSNDGNPFGVGIFRFALADIDYSSTHNDGFYQNYACSEGTALELNKTYDITVQTGTTNNEAARVYIDYNNNGSFESGESVVSFPSNKDGARTLTFTTPSSGVITNEPLRLRVLSRFNSIPSDACNVSGYGQAEDYTVVFVDDISWTGTNSTNWASAGNWSLNSIPNSNSKIKIPSDLTNYPVLTSDVTCESIQIDNGASLTIKPTYDLSINGYLNNDAGTSGLIIKSDATGTGSIIHNSTRVDATFERFISKANNTLAEDWQNGWHFLSSPMISQAIDPNFTGAPYDFFSWYEPQSLWVNYKNTTVEPTWNTVNGSTNFTLGKAYMVAYDYESTKQFEGKMNTEDVNLNGLSISGVSQDYSAWHFVGNPFGSALSWDGSADWDLTNIGGVIKIWNESNQSYSDLSSSPASEIPATNGFFVQVLSDPGSLTLPASKRVHSSAAFYKKSQTGLHLKLSNTTEGNTQENHLFVNPKSSFDFDSNYDSEFLAGYAPHFYAIVNDKMLSTNTIPTLDINTEISFGFVKNTGNNYELLVLGTETLDFDVLLLDLKNGASWSLTENPKYTFEAYEGDPTERFKLVFAEKRKEAQDIKVYSKNGMLYLEGINDTFSLEILAINGQSLFQTTTRKTEIPLNLASGNYIVKISIGNQLNSFKVFID